jgi:2,4-dienoyl-CoA reductase-like NADH-dependent reductase (Old Yellow Enzyme family)
VLTSFFSRLSEQSFSSSTTTCRQLRFEPSEISANDAISACHVDAVAFGTTFPANPDLPAPIKAKAELNSLNPSTFYSPGPKGYVD